MLVTKVIIYTKELKYTRDSSWCNLLPTAQMLFIKYKIEGKRYERIRTYSSIT